MPLGLSQTKIFLYKVYILYIALESDGRGLIQFEVCKPIEISNIVKLWDLLPCVSISKHYFGVSNTIANTYHFILTDKSVSFLLSHQDKINSTPVIR